MRAAETSTRHRANGHDGTPVHDLTAEQWVIGSALIEPDLLETLGVVPMEFHQQANGQIWRTMLEMHEAGKPVDAVTLAQELDARGTLDDVGGVAYLLKIGETVPHAGHAAHHAEIVRDLWKRREIVEAADRAIRLARDRDIPVDTAAALMLRHGRLAANADLFPMVTAADLDAQEIETEYLVEYLLVRGQPGVMAGGKKCLKTGKAIDLALSLDSSSPFLGKFRVPRPVRTALMSGESGAGTIQETARRIARSKGRSLSDFEVLFSFSLPMLAQDDHARALERMIEKHKLEVCIIDPAYLCMDLGDSAGNLFAVGVLLQKLTGICQRTGCTIVIVHHAKKGIVNPYQAPELEDIAWAGFQEWARQWLLIGRREAYDPEQGGSHKLWLNVGGSAGHCGLWAVDIDEGTRQDVGGRRWDVNVMPASEARQDAQAAAVTAKETAKQTAETIKAGQNREKVLKALKRIPDGETEKVFRELAGMSGRDFKPIIVALLEEGAVEACTVKKSNRTHDAIRLKSEQRDTAGHSGTVPVVPMES